MGLPKRATYNQTAESHLTNTGDFLLDAKRGGVGKGNPNETFNATGRVGRV